MSFKNSTKIDGVLYAHDDVILNETELSLGRYPFESSKIIHNMVNDRSNPTNLAFRAFPDGHVESFNKEHPGSSYANVSDFYAHANMTWPHFLDLGPYCAQGLVNLAKDPNSRQCDESDGSSLFIGQGQSDFMFVPSKFVIPFAEAAELLLQHGIFIEWYVLVLLRNYLFTVLTSFTPRNHVTKIPQEDHHCCVLRVREWRP